MLMSNRKLSEPIGYKGTAQSVVTAGLGTPMASPELKEVFHLGGVMPEGLKLVTSPSIVVAIDEKGFLVPADGKLLPYGVIGQALRSTEHLRDNFKTSTGDIQNNEGCISSVNGMDDLHGITPTVFQYEALFERGYSYKKDGASKSLFEFKPGQLFRPIAKTELDTAVTDGTLPLLFGETSTSDCPKTKGYYAGMPVVFGDTDKAVQRCGRIASVLPGNQYDNMIYTNNKCFDYNLQGKDTAGLGRNVWNSFETTYKNDNYIKTIVEFYVAM